MSDETTPIESQAATLEPPRQPGEIVPQCGTTLDVYLADGAEAGIVTVGGRSPYDVPGRVVSAFAAEDGLSCLRLALWGGDRLVVRHHAGLPDLTTAELLAMSRMLRLHLQRDRFFNPLDAIETRGLALQGMEKIEAWRLKACALKDAREGTR